MNGLRTRNFVTRRVLDDYERLFKLARVRERIDEGVASCGGDVRRTHQVYGASASVKKRDTHQEKTCEDITPYGVITQFPKNGRLFTPKYRLITPSTFDHTEKKLFTPSIYKITLS